MIFSIGIYSAPYTTQSASTALHFSKTLIGEGHKIYRLFFYSDGVHNASSLTIAPQDEKSLQAEWDTLIKVNKLDSVVCVSSALKRGVLSNEEAQRQGLTGHSLRDSSEISGLGQFIDAYIHSDRVISFG